MTFLGYSARWLDTCDKFKLTVWLLCSVPIMLCAVIGKGFRVKNLVGRLCGIDRWTSIIQTIGHTQHMAGAFRCFSFAGVNGWIIARLQPFSYLSQLFSCWEIAFFLKIPVSGFWARLPVLGPKNFTTPRWMQNCSRKWDLCITVPKWP